MSGTAPHFRKFTEFAIIMHANIAGFHSASIQPKIANVSWLEGFDKPEDSSLRSMMQMLATLLTLTAASTMNMTTTGWPHTYVGL